MNSYLKFRNQRANYAKKTLRGGGGVDGGGHLPSYVHSKFPVTTACLY